MSKQFSADHGRPGEPKPHSAASGRDYLTKGGASILRDALISYWFLRTDDPRVLRVFFAHAVRDAEKPERFDLRSDMIDGTPRGYGWRWNAGKGKWELIRAVKEQGATPLVGTDDARKASRVGDQTESRSPRGARASRALKSGMAQKPGAL